MGLFKELGEIAGAVAGVAIGAPIYLVGAMTNSDYIKGIADAAADVTVHTGKLVGTVTDSTVKCATGIINSDSKKAEEGFAEVIECSANTIVGMGKGLLTTAEKGIDTISAIAEGDEKKALKAGKELLKIVAVSALAVGVCDVVGGIDADGDGIPDLFDDDIGSNAYASTGGNQNGGTGPNFVYADEPPTYWVDAPHTKNGGYYRTMPDASISNNLSSFKS